MIVLARCLAINDVLACADDGVAAGCATCANALGFFQEPDAHFETKIGGSKRPDGTDIDCVKRIIVLQLFAGMRRQDRVAAAIDKPKDVVVRYLLTKPDTPRAENATLVI